METAAQTHNIELKVEVDRKGSLRGSIGGLRWALPRFLEKHNQSRFELGSLNLWESTATCYVEVQGDLSSFYDALKQAGFKLTSYRFRN